MLRSIWRIPGSIPSTEWNRFFGREPGQSLFLSLIYRIFGAENHIAIFALQGVIHLFASFAFSKEWERISSKNAGAMCFFILLLLPSVFHAIFSVYRESFALSLFLLFAAGVLHLIHNPSWKLAAVTGVLLGLLILTYAPFILLPIFLIPVFFALKLPRKHIGLILILCAVVLVPWLSRNYLHKGEICFAGCNRAVLQWYVRAEQAEHIRGMEPLHCLIAEYVTRDWEERSDYCSFNRVWHEKWPEGFHGVEADKEVGRESVQKIFEYFPHYLWFSVFEVLEFHIPYVNGWGFLYNVLASIGIFFVYVGCFSLDLQSMAKGVSLPRCNSSLYHSHFCPYRCNAALSHSDRFLLCSLCFARV